MASIAVYKEVGNERVDPREDEGLQEKIRDLNEKIDSDRRELKIGTKVHKISHKRVMERLNGYGPLKSHLTKRVCEHFVSACELAGKRANIIYYVR